MEILSKQKNLENKFAGFRELMPWRVQDILLVCSPYDAFIIEEEGNLDEKIFSEYVALQLRHSPRLIRAATGEEALSLLEVRNFDMIITMTRLVDMNVTDFGSKAKQIDPNCPLVMLAYDKSELLHLSMDEVNKYIDRLFVWSGNASIMLAIIKSVEDAMNAEHDTRYGLVRVVIVIEDSVRYYSLFLPIIYTEVMRLTRELMDEGLNDMHKLLRMRARPKILLAHSYEEGMTLYEKYKKNLLGIISDVQYMHDGYEDPEAGFKLVQQIKQENPDMPISLQSANDDNRQKAESIGARFINKNSRYLLPDLRNFLKRDFGFGDFVFRMPDGTEVDRAETFAEFQKKIETIPEESLLYHTSRNHFSNWLMARTEFALALKLAPGKPSDFETIQELREYLIQAFVDSRNETQSGIIADFSQNEYDIDANYSRLGAGSLGGKGRGLGFINMLLSKSDIHSKYPDVKICVPTSIVICTDEFDRFIEKNKLDMFFGKQHSDEEITQKFLDAKIDGRLKRSLRKFLKEMNRPIAVRSSSLLEDSHYQPFAGIYKTYMLPNNSPDINVRLNHLCDAIKLIYSSIFINKSISFIEATQYTVGEEKMAVIVQELVGKQRGEHFYPIISGVAQSYNYYPFSYQMPEEGIMHLALGLGKTIVDGGDTLRVSPARPKLLPQYSSAKSFVKGSQKKFYALHLSNSKFDQDKTEDATLVELDLDQAEKDDTLKYVCSVYSPNDDVIRDSLDFSGPRVVTFAWALKLDWFPLPEIIKDLLELGKYGMGTDVEIEFAVDIRKKSNEINFYFLQIRPQAAYGRSANISFDGIEPEDIFCKSDKALGNGISNEISDIVLVDPARFDSAHTIEIASEISEINQKFRDENRRYILIGPGRWGSSDRWLGIPVTWEQISKVGFIVEVGMKDFNPSPSYGSHFFQNITALNVGYLNVPFDSTESFIDWDWLHSQEKISETRFTKHIRTKYPVEVRIDGHSRHAAFIKGHKEETQPET